jgi:hypothetical protein
VYLEGEDEEGEVHEYLLDVSNTLPIKTSQN